MQKYYKEINESMKKIEAEFLKLETLIILSNKEDDMIEAEKIKLDVIEGRYKKNDNTQQRKRD